VGYFCIYQKTAQSKKIVRSKKSPKVKNRPFGENSPNLVNLLGGDVTPLFPQIVKAVVAHENALRKQAAKMNVESLRSNAVTIFSFLSSFGGGDQGCQIFRGTTYENGKAYTKITIKYTKCPENTYTKCPQNIPNVLKIYQMSTKYTK
jgi:hypothetical protein